MLPRSCFIPLSRLASAVSAPRCIPPLAASPACLLRPPPPSFSFGCLRALPRRPLPRSIGPQIRIAGAKSLGGKGKVEGVEGVEGVGGRVVNWR